MKDHIEILESSLIDFKGEEHKMILVAISRKFPQDIAEVMDCNLKKVLYFGVSICNPGDPYDYNVGVKIAKSRALNSVPILYATNAGVINTPMVEALLKQEAEYIKNNPGTFISGYNKAKEDYEYSLKMQEYKESFTEDQNAVIENLSKNPSYLDKILEYFKWFKK